MTDLQISESETQFNQLRGEAVNAIARLERALTLKTEQLGVSASSLSIGKKLEKISLSEEAFKRPKSISKLIERARTVNDWRRDFIHSENCIIHHPDGSIYFLIKNISGTHAPFPMTPKEIRDKISEVKKLAKEFGDQALKDQQPPAPTSPAVTSAKSSAH